jgi:hypothetical protein
MKQLQAIYAALVIAAREYPNAVATVLSVIVLIAARLGLHVTVTELIGIASAASVLFGTLAHTVYRKQAAKQLAKATLRTPLNG